MMRFIIILAMILILVTNCIAAEKKICTREEAIQAEEEAEYLKDWDSLSRSFKRFAHCDDASISEGYSASVGRLLAFNWSQLERLIELTKSDKEFEHFVLKHIDETVPADQLKKILENSRKHCPPGAKNLCKSIEAAAQ